jgi:hypothetical protein
MLISIAMRWQISSATSVLLGLSLSTGVGFSDARDVEQSKIHALYATSYQRPLFQLRRGTLLQ